MSKSAIPVETQKKFQHLQDILRGMGKVLVAFSGGVDSTLLLKTAQDILGSDVIAVIANSPIYPEREQREALRFVKDWRVNHRVIQTKEWDDPRFRNNPPERCYFCKRELFSRLREIAAKEKIPYVCDGSNDEDTFDFRPGTRAAQELGVRSPLKEARLGKSEIRILSKKQGLMTWDKPAMACLASRIPYHTAIDRESLRRIDEAEEYLKSKGFSQLRVRHHGQTARIEIDPEEFAAIIAQKARESIVSELKKMGYFYVTLDLAGYRTGSMNEPILGENPSSPEKADDTAG
jgi:uncharacterized protein